MPLKLSAAEVSFFVHATEDEERLLETVAKSLGVRKELFKQSRMTGHFNNPITHWSALIRGEEATRFAEALVRGLSQADRSLLRSDLSSHADEHGCLYLRLDKQTLFSDRVELGQSDPVRVKLRPVSRWRKTSASEFEEIL